MSETTKTKEQLKEEFIKNRGYWSKFWEDVLELDSNFFSTYSRFSSVPSKNNTLSPKIREFIYIAIDASTTHLYLPGLKLHMENALALGATRDEIMEVLELTSVLGIHTCTMGVPILMDELRKMGRGDEIDNIEYGGHEKSLKEKFIKNRGYWSPFWDDMLKLSPEFFECYLDFSSVPWKSGTLEPKVKEFIYIAIDTATTHLHEEGARIHIRNALNYGATKEEIMEVFQCVSVLGMHALTEGGPMLRELAEK
ncbi:MAG: gamma-carboxymuconolactone decarboxylase [Rhodospirillaceae bacterium]|nr:gamma-carboxymuconolactone decarboxylase [Rhodospirillaceae bacterium]|tara:strand:+ start:277 stop:1035 length:759 start_codon:yes stop_codon:yes gene_type:complete